MGFSYLDGECWWKVSREERFFCQHLYGLLVSDRESRIFSLVRDCGGCELPRADKWEPAFEVCFYRDLLHSRCKKDKRYSRKRTFDLCLFSEKAIVVIEAKAQQGFRTKQLQSFTQDREKISKITGVEDVRVYGLVSSGYNPSDTVVEAFDGPLLTWRCLSELYGRDEVLLRADGLYENSRKRNLQYMCGHELIEAHQRGEAFCVGRNGGLFGADFRNDLQSGDWRTRVYKIESNLAPPNRNWFLLSEFAEAAM